MRSTQPLLVLVAAALSACAAPREQPASKDSGLAEVFERSLARRAAPVLRHLIDGRVYYYAVSPCCDIYNPLYDELGKYVCAPDGGFSGRGDERCPPTIRIASGGVSVPNPFYKR
jgi:hypothetical protein